MTKLKAAFEVPILVAAAFAAVLIAMGVGYKAGNTHVEYEGDLWCVSNYLEKEPTEYTKDGQPVKHPLLESRGDWVRKDQIKVSYTTDDPREEAMGLAVKEVFFERATKQEMIAALESGDKDFFTHHFNEGATSAGPCWGDGEGEDDGKWINDAIREECLEGDTASTNTDQTSDQASGKCGDLSNPSAVSEQAIKDLLTRQNSPLKDHTSAIMQAANKYSVNPALMVAISAAESTFGKAGSGAKTNNPGNLAVSEKALKKAGIAYGGRADNGYTIFNNLDDGMTAMAEVLSRNYLKKGRDSIGEIAPVYTGSKKPTEWIQIVNSYMKKLCKQ